MISVLVVDDEPDLLDIARLYLEEQRGFRIECASSAKEALHNLQEKTYDLIVSDYMMPEMNGIEFLKKLRGKKNYIPFIIFTARGRAEIVIEALNAGADFYFQRRGEPEAQYAELAHIIRKMVRQHRAEIALAESEERYRRITEGLTDYLYTVSIREGKAVSTVHGPACAVVTGYTDREFASNPYLWFEMVVTDDRERVAGHFRDVLDNKTSSPVEHRIVRKDGQVRWVRDTPIPRFDPDGRLISYDGVVKDITETRQAEEELRKMNRFQESIIINANVWLMVLDKSGRILLWNKAAEEISGYRKEDVAGSDRIWRALYPDREYRKTITGTLLGIISEKKYLQNFETTIRTKSGDNKTILWNTRAFEETGGSPESFVTIGVDITKSIRAEQAIRRSENKLNAIVRGSPIPQFVIDRDHKVINWNEALEKYSGIKAEEIVGTNQQWRAFYQNKRPCMADLLADGAIEKIPQWYSGKYAKSRLIEDAYEATDFFPHMGESGLWLFFTAAPIRDADGRITGAVETLEDVTERKRAEEALQIQHNLALELNTCHTMKEALELILDAALQSENLDSGGIYMADPVTGAVDLIVHRGLSPEMVEHASHYDADAPQVLRGKSGTPFFGRYADIRQPGKDVIRDREGVTALASIPVMHEGMLVAIMNMASHVHEDIPVHTRHLLETLAVQCSGALVSIRSEEALRESEARLRTTLEILPVGVFIFSKNGQILTANAMVNRIWGVTDGVVPHARDMQEFVENKGSWPDTGIALQPEDWAASRVLLGGETAPVDIVSIHRFDGKAGTIIVSAVPLHDPEGDVTGAVAVIQDITERKRAEEALASANRKLNLLSSITRHDINNQMTALQGFVELLEQQQPDRSFAEYFKKINAAADRISAMIQFTKTYESIGVNATAWQDAGSLIDIAVKDVALLHVKLKNDIPAGTEVYADPLISRVFYNLMDNAVRYGGKITTIRFISEERNGDRLIICEDDGEGVPADEKEKIFGRGYGKNTGLGLFLARAILDITGITIKETGEPGRGARFEMTVPRGMWRMKGAGA